MRPRRTYVDYLRDILDDAEKAERFTTGFDFAGFVADDRTTFAVVRALEVIGEAAKKLPASVRNRAPGIPWRSIAGMRDKLTHEYFGVNLAVVWKTVHEDLPPLRSAVERILSDIDT